MSLVKNLIGYFWERKKFWLFPVVFMLILFSVLIILHTNPAIAPIIYTIF